MMVATLLLIIIYTGSSALVIAIFLTNNSTIDLYPGWLLGQSRLHQVYVYIRFTSGLHLPMANE